jgi:hypothetical protein
MPAKNTVVVAPHVIETAVVGAIDPAFILAEWNEYKALGGAEVWIFLADQVTGYDPASLDSFVTVLKLAAKTCGLRTGIVVSANPMVKMSTGILTVRSGVAFSVVPTQAEARMLAART